MTATVTRLPNVPPPAGVSSNEVADRARITYRMLDHWLRARYITCAHNPHSGSGSRRYFTPEEAAHVYRMAALIEAGFRVDVAANVARDLADREAVRIGHALTITEASA